MGGQVGPPQQVAQNWWADTQVRPNSPPQQSAPTVFWLYLWGMAKTRKNRQEILAKLGIEALNPMQQESIAKIHEGRDLVLLSPTGTGKTLAFLLPAIAELDADIHEVQVLIIVPSRELALQIEQVTREMGSGYKANAFYGGQNFSKDRTELHNPPAILIGTPGRIADHIRRETFSTEHIKTLVLDEFDKSLEVGFEGEMIEICDAMPDKIRKILTSATSDVAIPAFVEMRAAARLDFLDSGVKQLELVRVISPEKDKLTTLVDLLGHLGEKSGIVFLNFKNSINRVSTHLEGLGLDHACFYGGLEQRDRERALIQFRNGSHRILLATDLAARGIDVPALDFIIHYHLPMRAAEFTHRNGRTARMQEEGTAYILQWEEEYLPDFIDTEKTLELSSSENLASSPWTTLFISGGRRDKISKGDIAGLFFKQGGLEKADLGLIELKQDCAFVAVRKSKVHELISKIDNSRLKKKKVRIKEV